MPNNPPKILMFMPSVDGPNRDGTTTDAINVAKSLALAEIPAILIYNGHANKFKMFEDAGVDVRRMMMPISSVKQHLNPLYRRKFSKYLSQFINDENIDIIHLGYRGSYIFNYLKKVDVLKSCVQQAATPEFKKIKLFDGGFRFNPVYIIKAWYRKYVRFNYKRAEVVICLSDAARTAAIRTYSVKPERAITVFPGVISRIGDSTKGNLRRELGIGPDEKVVVSVGRITKEKGVEDFCEMAKSLKDSGRNYRFIFIGQEREGSYGNAIRDKYGKYVTFLGHRLDTPNIYADADLYVHASHRESGPLTIIEAMEHGTPSVAWNIPGCNEQIVDGLTGSLVELGNIAALAQATEELLENAKEYENSSNASVERFKRHSLTDYAPRLMKVLEYALANKNGR
jgi:glycosyltransferase involved in cell wall biosynthesis